ncbi:hypothetical protein IEQ34_003831 [Dendrobium chrysotoxum]|uniref:Prolamin-like domain-containing protein n=1 Tax=Dendrobium chrysotoxum TaxID=161865 RepID=A0AAV7HGJ2_DENCH|nr:hypothetical protein IEQ34_003831 [Dendrobium chrysotoxum]
MEEKAPPAQKTNAILLVLVIGIVFNLTFTTARPMSMATSGCKALPQYVATAACKALPPYVVESCAAGDWVFDAFRVCCDFLSRVSAECLTSYLPEFVAGGVEDVSLYNGCLVLFPIGRANW